MPISFVQSLLHERLGELLAALDTRARGRGHFSMKDAREVAESLAPVGAVEVTPAQAITIVRFLRGKGKWRGIGPNPVYVGKAKGRFKSEYRVLPAGHRIIGEGLERAPGSADGRFQRPARRKRHIQMLAAFHAAHPTGASMSALVASVMGVAPGATPSRIKRLAALAIREGLLVQKGRGKVVVAPGALPEDRPRLSRSFTNAAVWIPIIQALPERLRDSDQGFTAQDLHAASWAFGDFDLGHVRLALRELVRAKYLSAAPRRGHYVLDTEILDLLEDQKADVALR